KGADLKELARDQLRAYAADNPNRFRIEGEPLVLSADLATPFSLVLHELATNAAKHGSLSRARGRVKLSWTVGTDRRSVRLVWEETGGPRVDRPGPSGLGTSLIDSAIPGAAVSREFRPDGLVCTIEVPLAGEEAERAAAQ